MALAKAYGSNNGSVMASDAGNINGGGVSSNGVIVMAMALA